VSPQEYKYRALSVLEGLTFGEKLIPGNRKIPVRGIKSDELRKKATIQ
jgi:hypothetical protein